MTHRAQLDYILKQTETGDKPMYKLSMIAIQALGTATVVLNTVAGHITSGQASLSILVVAFAAIFITYLTSEK